jgi:predicted CXXCH cytochrome family protein
MVLPGSARTAMAQATPPIDVIGMHDLSPGSNSPIKGTLSGSCLYCHAPHSGLNGTAGVSQTPLWDQRLSSVSAYTVYKSTTLVNKPNTQPPLGTDSTLCLSCHDGTVAGSPGALVPYGNVPLNAKMSSVNNGNDVFGEDLSTMHPISFQLPLQAAPDLFPSLTATPPTTHDDTGVVRLINGNVECTSCHNPHVQDIVPSNPSDPNNPYFLVINNTGGALCLACHSTNVSGPGMGLTNPLASSHATTAAVGSQLTAKAGASNTNPLAGWTTGIHATAPNKLSPQISIAGTSGIASRPVPGVRTISLGHYSTVSKNACSSCHAEHNAAGETSLLRGVDDQTCLICHNGSSNISPAIPSVLAEMTTPKYGHAFAVGNSPHRVNETVLLNQSIHVTCVDCHNPHSSGRVGSFPAAPAVRLSQTMISGISASDGKSVVSPAANQYENCLRCHGTSTGKKIDVNFGYLPVRVVAGSDPLNVIPEFSSFATSSHPVFHDRMSVFPQPSLRVNILNLDGRTLGRSMGTRILCSDCHNSDDNREFGGTGPNGPHGSIFPHILERRYEFTKASFPGKAATNLFPNPILSAQGGAGGGPYALCAKCHDLSQIVNNTSFSEHARHVQQDGFSCSVCHTGHGMGAQSGTITGERLVNFDVNVVAPNGSSPISYSRATNSCALVCHNHTHQLRTAAGSGKIGIR